tara:strand:+ start:64 stop:288 length:225 start_codon:yes stop_codon:yes gene_type:complete
MYTQNKEILKKFGSNIRLIRNKLDVSQEKLAGLAGCHRTYIGMIERGEKNITLTTMAKLAKALNVQLTDLIKEL